MSFFSFRNENGCYKLPWLNKGCDALVSRKAGLHFELDASHISHQGIVTQHQGDSSDVRLMPITAIEAVEAFLKGKDIKYLNTSSPGLALNRILEMLGGLDNCDLFQNIAVRELLDELASGASRLASEVRGAINKSLAGYKHYDQPATKEQIAMRAKALLDQAVEAKVFRIGLEFQCSRCKRHNWYAVTEFHDSYNCKSCFAHELTPRLDETKWYYASDGFFRSSNKLDGNITILLALRFFYDLFERDLKFAPSFEYKCDKEQHEMDFAILSSGKFSREAELIFGESKSGAALKEDERRKLKSFGDKTESYLCFCTLADDFDETDKVFFKDLVDAKLKLIMLDRSFLEMDYFSLSKYRSENHTGRSRTTPEWLMRATLIRTLGKEFAAKHSIWL